MLNFAMMTPLFADNFDGLFWLAVGGVLVAVFVFGLVTLFTARYKRCPSNRVLVIYGKAGGGEAAKWIHGGAKFVLPLVQDFAYLNLEPIQIEIPLRGAVGGKYPRQRAQRVHRRHRHHAGSDAKRGHSLAWA